MSLTAQQRDASVQKHYAHSLLSVKSIDEDEDSYHISGIASTPTPDRYGDVVEPLGAQFKLPMPLLWQHASDAPVGRVEFAKAQRNGIPFKAALPKIAEAGKLRDRVEEAIQSIKYRLVSGVSIGFRAMRDGVELLETGGIRFKNWEWLELSLVTIPANAEATLKSIQSIDRVQRAASGHSAAHSVVRLVPSASVLATPTTCAHKETHMNIAEQLRAFEAKRDAASSRLAAIMEKAGDEGRTLDDPEQVEYDDLSTEVKSVDAHLVRLRDLQGTSIAKATRVTVEAGSDPHGAVQLRGAGGGVFQVERKLPPGIEFARYVMALAAARGDLHSAHEIAKSRFSDTPRVVNVLKAAVAAGTTTDPTWAKPLVEYTTFAGDFVEFLRPKTIIGSFGQNGVPSLRAAPFNVNIRGQTSGGQGYWVGQGKPKPLTKFDFVNYYLGWSKVANIAVITEELARTSSPSAEGLVRDSLAGALIERMDTDFIDPAKALVANVSPASITNGIVGIPSSGNDLAAIVADIQALIGAFQGNLQPLTNGVWIMSPGAAMALSMAMTTLGQPAYPTMSLTGGRLGGLPVIVSDYANRTTPAGLVILVNADDIWLADDGDVVVDASREASLQMDDAPTNASDPVAATALVSMFQTNSIALRAERWVNWMRRRATAVAYLTGVTWGQGGATTLAAALRPGGRPGEGGRTGAEAAPPR